MNKLWLVAITVVLVGCQGRKADQQGQSADSADVEQSMEQLMLPDTSYASVEAVKYVVEDVDSLPHPLHDFDDRYAKANGVFAFRRNLQRDASFGGKVKGTPTAIDIAWSFETSYDKTHI